MTETSSGYPLGYTEDEARRLAAQAAFFEDLTRDVFRRAGVGVGMHVLDLGCGVGDISFLAADMVGAAGTVLGIDRNASSIETAPGARFTSGLLTWKNHDKYRHRRPNSQKHGRPTEGRSALRIYCGWASASSTNLWACRISN